jgi:ribosomal protein L37AE/L43A
MADDAAPPQRSDSCPACGTARLELVVAPGRFYCSSCGIAGLGPAGQPPDEQLMLEFATVAPPAA